MEVMIDRNDIRLLLLPVKEKVTGVNIVINDEITKKIENNGDITVMDVSVYRNSLVIEYEDSMEKYYNITSLDDITNLNFKTN